jgi:hypothetical protein
MRNVKLVIGILAGLVVAGCATTSAPDNQEKCVSVAKLYQGDPKLIHEVGTIYPGLGLGIYSIDGVRFKGSYTFEKFGGCGVLYTPPSMNLGYQYHIPAGAHILEIEYGDANQRTRKPVVVPVVVEAGKSYKIGSLKSFLADFRVREDETLKPITQQAFDIVARAKTKP